MFDESLTSARETTSAARCAWCQQLLPPAPATGRPRRFCGGERCRRAFDHLRKRIDRRLAWRDQWQLERDGTSETDARVAREIDALRDDLIEIVVSAMRIDVHVPEPRRRGSESVEGALHD
jgi:hypothetical protein